MKKKIQWFGCLLLMVCSWLYDDRQLQKEETAIAKSYVVLEGAFLKTGQYEFEGSLTVGDLVSKVGVYKNASLASLNMSYCIEDESSLYLPYQKANMISLNHASMQELMTLPRVGEKTAKKIIDYRQNHIFECLEDIMKISGIGEKTFMKMRDELCL